MPEGSKSKSTRGGPAAEVAPPAKKTEKFVFGNGDVYEGEYDSNQTDSIYRHGKGTFTCKNGIVYTGEWQFDKMHGKGSYIHPSGMKYEGEFIDGKFEGFGVYTWPDGSIYEGEFKNSKLDGNGIYKDITGQIWTGKFRGNAAPGLRFKLNM